MRSQNSPFGLRQLESLSFRIAKIYSKKHLNDRSKVFMLEQLYYERTKFLANRVTRKDS